MFERMENLELVYKGGTLSKTPIRAYANHDSLGRKHKGGEATLPINPKKGRARKCNKNHAGHQSDSSIGAKKCLVHGTRHSKEEWKLLKE